MRGLVNVRFTVNLAELKRAVRRLTMRMGHESAIDERFVILRVAPKRRTIETVNSLRRSCPLKSTNPEL